MSLENCPTPLADRVPVRSSAKVAAWHLLNDGSRVGERRLFALVDAVASLLDKGRGNVGLETARCALETVVPPAVALAVVRVLIGDDGAV